MPVMARFVADTAFVTLQEAARRLDLTVDQMLAWNMAVIHDIDGFDMVPTWSVDPQIARYLPTLSQVFQGEALSYCLTRIRPLDDGRDGLAALRDGEWRAVLDCLQSLRVRFDRVMGESWPEAEEPEADPLAAMVVQRPVARGVTLH